MAFLCSEFYAHVDLFPGILAIIGKGTFFTITTTTTTTTTTTATVTIIRPHHITTYVDAAYWSKE